MNKITEREKEVSKYKSNEKIILNLTNEIVNNIEKQREINNEDEKDTFDLTSNK